MRIVTAALLVLGLLGTPDARASEVMLVYCPATALGGMASYTPGGVSTISRNNDYELKVTATCDGGADTGVYRLTMKGVATGVAPLTGETCAQSHDASGTLTGSGPHGTVSGGYSFDRAGVHYVITGTFTMGGKAYSLLYWLDVPALGTCPLQDVSGGEIVGHGAIVRHKTGLGCGMVYGRDRTTSDPDLNVGEITAGPWVAPGAATSVRITCFVSVGDATPDPEDVRVSYTTPGPVGVLPPTTVAFDAAPGTYVWVCIDVTWQYLGGGDGGYQECQVAVGVQV